MKLIDDLMEAVLRVQVAQADVDRIVAEIEAKADGRRQPKRKVRRRKMVKAKDA